MTERKLRVSYTTVAAAAAHLDLLADTDPLELRNLAINLVEDVETLKAALTEAQEQIDQLQGEIHRAEAQGRDQGRREVVEALRRRPARFADAVDYLDAVVPATAPSTPEGGPSGG